MKNIIYALFVLIALMACHHSDNGDLDGMWQLTGRVELPSGEQTADKRSRIYWHVQMNLMKLEDKNLDTFYLAHFRHTADSLLIEDVHQSPFDSIVPLTKLAHYGVEPDGKFRIETLDAERMVLRNEKRILTFRKY